MRRVGLVLMVTFWSGCYAATPRPLYVIGHMANKLSTVDDMLNKGANTIEADLSFDKTTGKAARFFHGVPCDCFRSCLEEEAPLTLMKYLRDLSTPGHAKFRSTFTGLLWIDMKLDGVSNLEASGKIFADLLINVFQTPGSKMKLLLGIMDPNHFKFINGVVGELRSKNHTNILGRIAAAGSQKEHFDAYIAANNALGLPKLWIDEGSSNCFAHFFSLTELRQAVYERDSANHVSKVCRWTIDTKEHMRNALSLGTDAIITNDPHDLFAVIQEADFSGIYRMATSSDDPFQRIEGHGPYRLGCHYRSKWYSPWAGTYQCWKDHTIEGSWCYTDRNCGSDRSSCLITDSCE